MNRGNTELNYDQLPVPEKVGIPHLQLQFKKKYELDDSQTEALVMSSCESLHDFLSDAEEILATNDDAMEYEAIRGVVHRAKGLFLIMGADSWAEYATSLKKSREGLVYNNLQIVVDNIRKNFTDIIVLCEK